MGADQDYEHDDLEKEVEEFEKTKAGVKGLIDTGITKVPRFFLHPSSTTRSDKGIQLQIPLIDFEGIERGGSRRMEVVEEIRKACESWGFFQMVNHGVPMNAMDAILESTRRFHEQPKEEKMDIYSSQSGPNVRFYTINGNFRKSEVVSWRDALACTFLDDTLDPLAIPHVCRKEMMEYIKHMINLRETLSELLSEALGLSPDFLKEMGCMKSEYMSCLYYPACPEPERTLGTVVHSDPSILTILVQDGCGGLQILHDNDWVDVPPIHGALIANIGDLLQLITNDKFKSVEHRVLARSKGTRVSAACFVFPGALQMAETYGPIKELVSQENPPHYGQVTYIDFVTHYQKKEREGHDALSYFRL